MPGARIGIDLRPRGLRAAHVNPVAIVRGRACPRADWHSFTRLVFPVFHHPVRTEQRADIDVGGVGHKSVADPGSRGFAVFKLGIKALNHTAHHIDFGFAIARVGFSHRPGGIEHEHHIGVGEVEPGLARHLDGHRAVAKQGHDRGWHRDARRAGDGEVLFEGHLETATFGAIGAVAVIEIEEPVTHRDNVVGNRPGCGDLRSQLLARREHA